MPALVVLGSQPAGFGVFRAATRGRPTAALTAPTPRAEAISAPVTAPATDDHPAPPAASRNQGRLVLAWPAPGIITSPFGDHRGHPGIDIDGITGDPVIAAGPGTVTGAGPAPQGFGGYGTIVAIDHGNGLSTLYAHLSRVDVATGQHVDVGQQIGLIGMTGIATGDHLHFEVRVLNVPVDPMLWLSNRGVPTSKPIPPQPSPASATTTAPAPQLELLGRAF